MVRGLFIAAVLTTSGSASAGTWVLEQPALGVPFQLEGASSSKRARLDVPAFSQIIELSAGRKVAFFASGELPVLLETETNSLELTLSLDEIAGTANTMGQVKLVREGQLREGGKVVARVTVEIVVDLMGIAAESPRVKLESALVHLKGEDSGIMAGVRVKRPGILAHTLAPLYLQAPHTRLEIARDDTSWSGEISLAAGLDPGSLRAGLESTVVLSQIGAQGLKASSFRVSAASVSPTAERWVSTSADGATTLELDWTKREGTWFGTVRSASASFQDASPLVILIGSRDSATVAHAAAPIDPAYSAAAPASKDARPS